MHFIIFLLLYRLINVLQPGSIKKINNPSQNWHQVTQVYQKEIGFFYTVLYYISFIGAFTDFFYYTHAGTQHFHATAKHFCLFSFISFISSLSSILQFLCTYLSSETLSLHINLYTPNTKMRKSMQ